MGLKENIKNKRLELGLTLEEVSNKIGIKKPTLQRYESGVISNIPSDKIEALAEVFDVSPAYLMGWEGKRETKSTYNPNVITEKDEKSIQKDLKKIMDDFKSGQDGPAFYNGVELDEEELELIEQAMELALRSAKIKNKAKYTPKKYRKDE
ncbi:helix-turn-helix transcriptional regulator [Romboutsia sp. MSSM.1001216sp_RTP31141st1_G3_RTP31141_220114]|uniref:helix-turn-helix domain-containing protein n=1 Tax=unclassified Romboutsia TaxID=2626894 RepID=UPI0031B5E024